MCKYCEEQKTIIDTFPVELKILPLEKIKKGKIVDKYYTLSINGIAYSKINYCPMCGRRLGGNI